MASRKIARDIFTKLLLHFRNNESCCKYPKTIEIDESGAALLSGDEESGPAAIQAIALGVLKRKS